MKKWIWLLALPIKNKGEIQMIFHGWPNCASRGFLNTSDLQSKELLPVRALFSIESCTRCNDKETVNELGSKMTHFACKGCRNDEQTWGFDGDYTIESMNYLSPLPEVAGKD